MILVAIGLLFVAALCFRFAIMLFRADPLEVEEIRRRCPTVRDAIMGRARVYDSDGLSDSYVTRGMVYNRKMKRFEPTLRTSDSALERTFR